jgi:multiple sugar transport system substrate-binding protein
MAHLPKKILATLAVVGLGAGLASCSSDDDGGDGPSNTDGRGPITFAMGKNDTDKLRPIIDKWNEENPDEEVSLQELAGEADAQRETLVQSLQAGSSDIDVMALDVIWTGEFAANGWIDPLQDDLEVDTSGLLESTVQSATYNDTLYALPQNTNGQLLYRNTEHAPDEVEDWDDVVSTCEDVDSDEGNTDCLMAQLSQYEGLTATTAGFMSGWGGGLVDDDDQSNVTSDESREGLQAMVDGYEDGTIAPSSTGATEEETNLAFTQGQSAMAINWPYMYTEAEAEGSAVADNIEVQPLVGKDGVGVSTLGGYNNAINTNSENKATALDFMEFIINEDNQHSFAEASFPPVLSSIYEDESLIEEFPYLPALQESLENAVPRPASPNYDEFSKAVQDNAYAAITGGKSVEDATDDMDSAIANVTG